MNKLDLVHYEIGISCKGNEIFVACGDQSENRIWTNSIRATTCEDCRSTKVLGTMADILEKGERHENTTGRIKPLPGQRFTR